MRTIENENPEQRIAPKNKEDHENILDPKEIIKYENGIDLGVLDENGKRKTREESGESQQDNQG